MATIYDVARRAGVSHTTVSAVLNDRAGEVGETTRKRVLQAAQELGYRPSRVARQLATGRSNIIGVCFEQTSVDAFSSSNSGRLVATIGDAAGQAGLYLLFAPTSRRHAFRDIVENLSGLGVDGAIIIGAVELKQETIDSIDSCPIPIVCVDSYPDFRNASTVDVDSAAAMRSGVRHLLDSGHRRICYFGPQPTFQCHKDRLRGFQESVQGLKDPDCVFEERKVTVEQMREMLSAMLREENRPTAIVADRWDYGVTAWEAVSDAGLVVPDDISLLLYDALPGTDHPGHAVVNEIQPTPEEMGIAAFDTLNKVMNGELAPPVNVRLPANVSLRPSPAPR